MKQGKNPQARLLLWFAGHGHTLDKEGYLVPADAALPSKNEEEFLLRALSLRRFGEYARLAKAKHALAVLDACFAGTIFNTARALPSPAITLHLAQPVRQYVSSGDKGQEVSDDGRFRNLFLKALSGEEKADANGDGYLTGTELGLYLSDRLTALTEQRQSPKYGKLNDESYDQGDFVFQIGGGQEPIAPQDQRESLQAQRQRNAQLKAEVAEAQQRKADAEERARLAAEEQELLAQKQAADAEEQAQLAAQEQALLVQKQAAEQAAEAAKQRLVEQKKPVVTPVASGKTLTDTVNGVNFEWVWVAGGKFTMGSNENDDEQPHKVSLSGFYLGKTEVTQGQWQAVMGSNPSYFSACGDTCPVERVSWEDVQDFIGKLKAKTGKTYRLPTEAEWEYAARSGGQAQTYAGGENLDVLGWYSGNSGNKTHPVAQKQRNGLGLYDMSGNVWEWVQDWYDSGYYRSSPVDNPLGPDSGSFRVLRGGRWFSAAKGCRADRRSFWEPGDRNGHLGARLVRRP